MKKLRKMTLVLLITIFASACTETVSENIENNTSIKNNAPIPVPPAPTPAPATPTVPRSISIKSLMNASSSFLLHKAGDITSDCELTENAATAGIGFDADLYSPDYVDTVDPANYAPAIDCIFDAQELDLFENGLKFEIQVNNVVDDGIYSETGVVETERLCEYIRYTPVKFMRYKTGRTNLQTFKVVCDAACAEVAPTICDNYYNADDANPVLNGALYTTLTTGAAFNPANFPAGQKIGPDEPVCAYDHSNINASAPNCDDGSITTLTINLSGTPADPSVPSVATCDAQSSAVTSVSPCGNTAGTQWAQCVGGPNIEEMANRGGSIYSSVLTEVTDIELFTQEHEYSSPLSEAFTTNMNLANFSRICSDSTRTKTLVSDFDMDDITRPATDPLPAVTNPFRGVDSESMYRRVITGTVTVVAGTSAVGGAGTNFSQDLSVGDVIYIAGERHSVSAIGSATALTLALTHVAGAAALSELSRETFGFVPRLHYSYTDATATDTDSVDTSENPFRSVHKTQPYYGVYCLDKAYDIKAQIRIFVREHDKLVSSSTNNGMELLNTTSDLSLVNTAPENISSRIDTRDREQAFGIPWNNIHDWDDFFERDHTGDAVLDYIYTDNKCTATSLKGAAAENSGSPVSDVNFPGLNF